MTFRRPPEALPRAFELIAFGIGVIGLIGMSIYLVDAASRGLTTWSEVPSLLAAILVAVLPIIGIGYLLRRSRLKKVEELREFERSLEELVKRA